MVANNISRYANTIITLEEKQLNDSLFPAVFKVCPTVAFDEKKIMEEGYWNIFGNEGDEDYVALKMD